MNYSQPFAWLVCIVSMGIALYGGWLEYLRITEQASPGVAPFFILVGLVGMGWAAFLMSWFAKRERGPV